MRRHEITVYNDEIKARHASQCRMILDVLRKNRDMLANVTFWGVDDRNSWSNNYLVRGRKNCPLLFDVFRCPKRTFFNLIDDAKEF